MANSVRAHGWFYYGRRPLAYYGLATGIIVQYSITTNQPRCMHQNCLQYAHLLVLCRKPTHLCYATVKQKTRNSASADKSPKTCARQCSDLLDTKCYEAQLSMLCCQELPSSEWLRFIGRILPIPLPSDALSDGIYSSYLVHIWHGKTRMAVLQSGEVAGWSLQSFGHNASMCQTYRQPRRHSKCRVNALCRVAKKRTSWPSTQQRDTNITQSTKPDDVP